MAIKTQQRGLKKCLKIIAKINILYLVDKSSRIVGYLLLGNVDKIIFYTSNIY